jgi:hypothetical protein
MADYSQNAKTVPRERVWGSLIFFLIKAEVSLQREGKTDPEIKAQYKTERGMSTII